MIAPTPTFTLAMALALSLAVSPAGPARAAQEGARNADAPNDPRMMAAYDRLVDFLNGLDAYDLNVRLDWQVEGDELGQRGSNRYRFLLDRPGKFRIEVRPGNRPDPSLIVVSDGETATTLYPPRSLYAQAPLMDDPAEGLQRNPIVAISLSGSLIDTLMRPDLVDVVASHASGGKFTGLEQVDGRELERYTLSWKGDEEELWIGPKAEPLPRKLVRIVTVPTGPDQATRLITT